MTRFAALLGACLLLVATLPAPTRAVSAPEVLDPAEGCVTGDCHEEIADLRNLHWAKMAEPGQCQRCHVPEENVHEFETAEAPESCFGCHASLATRMSEGRVPHPAAEDGCADCHAPHGGPARALLIDVEEGDLRPLCFGCHDEEIIGNEYKHGPAAHGACNICHDPHVSENDTLLLAAGAELCGKCHEEIALAMAEAAYVHSPAEDGCTDCHNPHSGPSPRMLQAEKGALCNECHDDVVATAQESAVQHSPATTGGECLNCHDPHAANSEPMLKASQRELCLGCHDRPQKAGDRSVANIADWLDRNGLWHQPIRKQGCAGCHQPHGGEHARLLKKPFPDGFYAPFEARAYGLCFGCHDKRLATTKTTRSASNFRDGDRNLHFVHVNKQERGRTCRACHEVHASSRRHQIRESIPYGRWLMPIAFEKSETGGSCAPGCHERVTYARDSK